ncbi:hypothetical protein E4T56_gene18943 [Termitomyces sp. T112]|nr:hypothetical protein E4T56_gene18943 [Termitomyces sp. T112]
MDQFSSSGMPQLYLPDVLENVYLCSFDGYTFHGLDQKQFRVEEHNVAVVLPPHSMACDAIEVEVGKVKGPLGLLAVELLGCPKVFEVLMLHSDLKLMLCAFQEVPPLLKQPDDGQHLLVMDLIVSLYQVYALGVEGHQMPLSIL